MQVHVRGRAPQRQGDVEGQSNIATNMHGLTNVPLWNSECRTLHGFGSGLLWGLPRDLDAETPDAKDLLIDRAMFMHQSSASLQMIKRFSSTPRANDSMLDHT
jgi:hypothetical protein